MSKPSDKNGMILTIFSAYVVPLLKDINHTALLQERKFNLDAAAYEKYITYTNLHLKSKFIFIIAAYADQPQ